MVTISMYSVYSERIILLMSKAYIYLNIFHVMNQ